MGLGGLGVLTLLPMILKPPLPHLIVIFPIDYRMRLLGVPASGPPHPATARWPRAAGHRPLTGFSFVGSDPFIKHCEKPFAEA